MNGRRFVYGGSWRHLVDVNLVGSMLERVR